MKIFNSIYKLGAGALFLMSLASTVGCSDDFLAEKRPYGSFGPEQVYADMTSVKLRLNYIYQRSLPYHAGAKDNVDNYAPDYWPVGYNDYLSLHTEEFPGYGKLSDPSQVWTNENIAKFFFYGINESPWKKMRECTDVIVRVNESTTLDKKDIKETEAQARFFRASRYFRLFKRFGGLPIVTEIQSTVLRDSSTTRMPRNSTEKTFNFIIEDLTTAGDILPVRWEEEANDWGRVTSGTAYALAGYVANYYASPVFNRNDESERWQQAYELNKKALEQLASGGFGLSYAGDPGVNASNWARIWCNVLCGESQASEGVFIKICNNAAHDENIHNAWEKSIRPSNSRGDGSITPTAEMIDAFPMADGKRPTETGAYSYDKKVFFLNRDPRFYRTFAFPGTEWQFNGSIAAEYLESECPYQGGQDYKLMNFAWYPSLEEALDTIKAGYFTDFLGNSGQSVYVRKKSQDYALGERTMINWNSEDGFAMNGQPLIAMRYTEVLLNFAEAACGAGKLEEAWDALVKIRQRVYGAEAGNCGLDETIRGDRAKMFEAILYERKIELAYEGKRFDDCHRWMLFDGGEGQSELNASWALTAWGGNTCRYLGVTPLNDITIHKLEMHFDPTVYTGAKDNLMNPFDVLGIERPQALTLNESFIARLETTTGSDGADSTYYVYADSENNPNRKYVEKLAAFYNQYLVRKDIATMTSTAVAGTNPVWDKKCYLMGLNTADQKANPNVAQTIGWNSLFGGFGVFDPLSKTPITAVEGEVAAPEDTPSEGVE